MKTTPSLGALIAIFTVASPVGAQDDLSTLHDGRWSVSLVCPDTRDRSGLVRGYRYDFDVVIDGGILKGQYGSPGAPASVSYTGKVHRDGSLEVLAQGNTGKRDYAVGRVDEGTAYAYTLHGKLGDTSGEASRREVRACTATFNRRR
jgi:hypothetical protein